MGWGSGRRNREVRVRYIPTNLNFADIMTKTLMPKKYKEGVDLIVNAKDAHVVVVKENLILEFYRLGLYFGQF